MFKRLFKTQHKKAEKRFLRENSTEVATTTSEYGPPIFNRSCSKLTRRWEKERYKLIAEAHSSRSDP